jgi:thioredoxin-like negative regulator of GroEL
MPNARTIHVACLCAAWCRLCDDYRAVLESLADELDRAGVPVSWHWVDIEDEADLVGDLDVETFPTIVVADDAHVRFAGALEPQPGPCSDCAPR